MKPAIEHKQGRQSDDPALPRIVILGAGFGGLACVKALEAASAEITLIDQRNFHLFQPLLYQVATAALSPADIATPIRRILRSQANTKVVLGHVEAIDRQACTVRLRESGCLIPYDTLVVATGARHSYFGHDDWEAFAPGLKQIEDALNIRNHVLDALERAEATQDADKRRHLLSFIIIGGGPTGVEVAGAIAELAKIELTQASRALHGLTARVLLIEAGPQILPSFVPSLAEKARHSLEQLGVEVLTGAKVSHCDADGVIAAGRRIEAGTLIWAAGVAASPAA
jgi:NADH:ubiquinone reductase (H+-translocating)